MPWGGVVLIWSANLEHLSLHLSGLKAAFSQQCGDFSNGTELGVNFHLYRVRFIISGGSGGKRKH